MKNMKKRLVDLAISIVSCDLFEKCFGIFKKGIGGNPLFHLYFVNNLVQNKTYIKNNENLFLKM